MKNLFKKIFSQTVGEVNEPKSNDNQLILAAVALLLEVAKADDNVSKVEINKIKSILQKKFNFKDEEVDEIISEAEVELEKSVSLYEFTTLLNEELNNDQKYAIVKYLWHIAYADGNLDAYEDHYIKKISNNLHIYNKERIAAKLEVKSELGF